MLGRAASDTVWVHGRTWKHGPGLLGTLAGGQSGKFAPARDPGNTAHTTKYPVSVSVRGRCHAGTEPNRFFLPRAVAALSFGLS